MSTNSFKDKGKLFGGGMIIPPRPETDEPPKTAPGQLFAFKEVAEGMQEEIDDLKLKLEKAEKGGGKRMYPLNRLHKVEGRQRLLTPDEKGELRDNLRENELDTPITLVKRTDGDWDIVSGNNRYDIYVELGRTEIEGIEKDYADDIADKQAFFSNLLHPSLSDYEKFLGFKMLMEKYNMTQDEVGRNAGIRKNVISMLMSFGKLPSDAQDIIKMHPTKLGSSAASELAALTVEGKGATVTEAIKDIVFRGVAQATAVAAAKRIPAQKKEAPAVQNYIIKNGKKKFAEMRGAKNSIRIDFADEEKRMKLEILIHDLIRNYSDA